MGSFFKWIGGGLGWFLGEWTGNDLGWDVAGPAFGIVGFIAGTVIDSLELRIFRKKDKKTTMGEFATNLLVLVAAVIKTEGPVVKAELDYVKHFLKQNFDEKEAVKALAHLKEILKQSIPLDDVCVQIRNNLDYSSRLQFVHFLYNLANIDGHLSKAEQNILSYITNCLKVNVSDKHSVGTMTEQNDSIIAAYAILGVHRTTSIIDIKKAYRNLAIKYHPDKVAFLGDELKKTANDKFQQLTRAYELIKKERNFS